MITHDLLTAGRTYDQALDDIVRQILMVDANNDSLTPRYESVLVAGLPAKAPKGRNRVIVIGAGIAGLLAGKLLKEAGYKVTILEANPTRVGGRVKTFHPVAGQPTPFQDPNAYAEAGAMRIPTIHPLVNRLINVLGMAGERQPFYNEAVSIDDPSKKTFSTWLRCNGIQVRKETYSQGKLTDDQRALGFPLPDGIGDKTASELFDAALVPLRKLVDTSLPIEDQIAGWKKFIVEYDDRSMYQFLDQSYKNTVVKQYIGTLENLTSRFFLSLFHSFLDTFFINETVEYHEIRGGNWRLCDALMKSVSDSIVMDARAVEIHCPDDGPVTVLTYTDTELNNPLNIAPARSFEGDFVVAAIPFSSMRYVRTTPLMSYGKRRAINELHYDSSTKILLEFSERFWEWGEVTWLKSLPAPYYGHAAVGGGSVTDEPNRYIYFPSHKPSPDSTHGVVIASYSWSDDATRWDSLTAGERASYALDGLCQIYGDGIRRFFTGRYQTQSWVEDSFACGEAAVFSPGQVMELQVNIPTPEGRIHFAGEHTSMKHAWIEGAVESAIRVALEISNAN